MNSQGGQTPGYGHAINDTYPKLYPGGPQHRYYPTTTTNQVSPKVEETTATQVQRVPQHQAQDAAAFYQQSQHAHGQQDRVRPGGVPPPNYVSPSINQQHHPFSQQFQPQQLDLPQHYGSVGSHAPHVSSSASGQSSFSQPINHVMLPTQFIAQPPPLSQSQPAKSWNRGDQGSSYPYVLQQSFAPEYRVTPKPQSVPAPTTSNRKASRSLNSASPVIKQSPTLKNLGHISHKHQQRSERSIDAKFLVSLAEEYFTEARKSANSLAYGMDPATTQTYQKLIATGLGCLEACLLNFELTPRLQAQLRLRYAIVVFEETENMAEAEAALSKGIALCKLHHYNDLHYCMQFLLAKVLFKSRPKSALKVLDDMISESQAYKHFAWVYAFRFLRATATLGSNKVPESHASILQLRAVASLAEGRNDKAIYMTASLYEVLAHLNSSTADRQSNIQNALACAFKYQLEDVCKISQISCLLHLVDLVCSFIYDYPEQTLPKLRHFQLMMEQVKMDDSWAEAGDSAKIPLRAIDTYDSSVSHDTRFILQSSGNGTASLVLSTFTQKNAVAYAALMSAIILGYRENGDEHKATEYLRQAYKILNDNKTASHIHLPLSIIKENLGRRATLVAHCGLYQAFCAALKSDWQTAEQGLDVLEGAIPEANNPDELLELYASYLKGTICQGTGRADQALKIFQHQQFKLPPESRSNMSPSETIKLDLAIIATMNTTWLLQHPSKKNPKSTSTALSELRPFCHNHANKHIRAAFALVSATSETDPPTPGIRLQNNLKEAFSLSKKIHNIQFLTIVLNTMCTMFFDGVVGDQAEKSGRAASFQAKKSGNLLWQSVGDGNLARVLDTLGISEDARMARAQGTAFANKAFGNSS